MLIRDVLLCQGILVEGAPTVVESCPHLRGGFSVMIMCRRAVSLLEYVLQGRWTV